MYDKGRNPRGSRRMPVYVSFHGDGGGVGTTSLTIAFANAVSREWNNDVLVLALSRVPAGAITEVPDARVTVSAVLPTEGARYSMIVIDNGANPLLDLASLPVSAMFPPDDEVRVLVARGERGVEPIVLQTPRNYVVHNVWASAPRPFFMTRHSRAAAEQRLDEAVSAHFEELAGLLARKLSGNG